MTFRVAEYLRMLVTLNNYVFRKLSGDSVLPISLLASRFHLDFVFPACNCGQHVLLVLQKYFLSVPAKSDCHFFLSADIVKKVSQGPPES